MMRVADSFALWLADYYLLSTALLAFVLAATVALKQPARRLAVIKATLVSLFLLAVLCSLPNWSLVHLITANRPERPVATQSVPERPAPGFAESAPLEQNDSVQITQPSGAAVASAAAAEDAKPFPEVDMASSLAFVHVAGAAFVSEWLTIGWLAARRLRRSANPAPNDLVAMLADIAVKSGSTSDAAELLTSGRIDVPVALGIWRPAVLLPREWVETHSHDQLRTVLAHEWSHVENRDLRWLAASRALFVVLWAQPLFWLLRRRMRIDQEGLADAAAAELTTRQRYAEQLVTWARSAGVRRSVRVAAAVGLWEGPSQLRQRIALLIDDGFTVLRSCPRAWRRGTAMVGILCTLLLSLLTFEPAASVDVKDAVPPAVADQKTSNQKAPSGPETTTGVFAAVGTKPGTPNTIAGRCVDDQEKPLAGVEVQLALAWGSSMKREFITKTTSDAEGRFSFENIVDLKHVYPDGKIPVLPDFRVPNFLISARAEGHASTSTALLRDRVARDGSTVDLTLSPAATLQGRVVNADGKPVAGALVSISQMDRWEGFQTARTDRDGKYEIKDAPRVKSGKVVTSDRQWDATAAGDKKVPQNTFGILDVPRTISVVHPDYASRWARVKDIPGTQDITLERSAVITGRVLHAETRQPVPGAHVQAITSQGHEPPAEAGVPQSPGFASATTDDEGRYKITSLRPGTYDLWAAALCWVNSGVRLVKTSAEQPTSAPDLLMENGGTIHVRLVDFETKKPLQLAGDERGQFHVEPSPPMTADPTIDVQNGIFELRALPGKSKVVHAVVSSGKEIKWLGNGAVGAPVTVNVVEGQATDVDVPTMTIKDFNNGRRAIQRNQKGNAKQKISSGIKSTRGGKMAAITVTGRAIDENDNPIPGAQIYLASPRNGARGLATTITGSGGTFQFNNIQLPIDRSEGKNAVGCFELFGQADGFGVAWRPLKWFYPDKPHGNDDSRLVPSYDRPTSFGRDDVIALDILFSPAAKLRGRVVNDLGEPIANTSVRISGAQPVGDKFDARDLESFSQSLVPDSVRIRRTDNDGRFEFTALPADHVFRLGMTPTGYTPRIFYAATQAEPTLNDEGDPVFGDDFDVVFKRPRSVKLRIVYGDTGQPAPKVGIGGTVTEAGFWETTNDDGVVDVPLPDGKFTLTATPRFGTSYLDTEVDLNVTAEMAERITTVKLQPAAVAKISVIDADTLEPIQGVDVWIENDRPGGKAYRDVHGYRSWEVETRISHYDSPTSDLNGEMRVFFEPGKHRIGVGLRKLPEGYEPVEKDGKLVELKAGGSQSIQFELRKRASTSEAPADGASDKALRVIPAALHVPESGEREKRPPTILSYGDGKADGKKSYGGSGHFIRFEMPKGVTHVKGIRIHGSRYGLPQAPDEDFEVTFLSEDRSEVLDTTAAPYRLFKRGKESWVRVLFDKEVELPPKFWIALNFNPHQTKGVYLSYDTSTKGEYSRVGLPGDEDEPKETDFAGDWMVQVMLVRPEKSSDAYSTDSERS